MCLYSVIFFTGKHLNKLALSVCRLMRTTNPSHPLFEQENYLSQVIERGKMNLDHDLFDEANSIFIFDCIRQVVFVDDQRVCFCSHDINCFLLQQVN